MNDISKGTDKLSTSNDATAQTNDDTLKMVHSCDLDVEFDSGVFQLTSTNTVDATSLLQAFESVLSATNISANPKKNAHYRKGWRSGGGSALAVLFPQTLIELWDVIKVSVSNNLIIVMQAANTGLTQGSTPSGNDYDRPVVVINTLALDSLYLINQGQQVISMPGATLHKLEQSLRAIGRAPHSVIGSSSLGASIVGGIANNSGGALVKRGPAYTELSVFAKIDEHGKLILVNHIGVDLGQNSDDVIRNLSIGNFIKEKVTQGSRHASDESYQARIKDVDANTPSRFNADPRRLYESSGCAGKLAVFAVRVDSHPLAQSDASFYVGTNNAKELYEIRRILLTELGELPEVGEYMHRDIFDVAEKYGKDTFLSVLYLGTQRLPKMFALKGRIDAIFNNFSWMPKYISDKVMQQMASVLPQHLPNRLLEYRKQYEHHLTLKLSDKNIKDGRQLLCDYFAKSSSGNFFECTPDEAKKAYLHRFAAAGAAIRYQTIHAKEVGEILSLDIALPRNEMNWVEQLPVEIEQQIDKKLYYGHFFCHVFHQDYVLKKGADAASLKKQMLALLDSRGAKYPAEHNVGHLYEAEGPLKQFYKQLDPTNSFNPGIGKMEKNQRNCQCCH
ncbi:MAG: D-lactate dehydrogenase [Patiriisocius sp.]|jgi:D-lactate dehydrogenase